MPSQGEQTPYEKIKKANDDYHEAVQEVLLDEEFDVVPKVEFAELAHATFRVMKQTKIILEKHYTPEAP